MPLQRAGLDGFDSPLPSEAGLRIIEPSIGQGFHPGCPLHSPLKSFVLPAQEFQLLEIGDRNGIIGSIFKPARYWRIASALRLESI